MTKGTGNLINCQNALTNFNQGIFTIPYLRKCTIEWLKSVPAALSEIKEFFPNQYEALYLPYDLGLFPYLKCNFTADLFSFTTGAYKTPAMVISKNFQEDTKICDAEFILSGDKCHPNVGAGPIALTNCAALEYVDFSNSSYTNPTLNEIPNENNITIYLSTYQRTGYKTPVDPYGACDGFKTPITSPGPYNYTDLITNLRTITNGTLIKNGVCYFVEQNFGPGVICQQSVLSELELYIGHFDPTQKYDYYPRSNICAAPNLCHNVTGEGQELIAILPILRLAEINGECG